MEGQVIRMMAKFVEQCDGMSRTDEDVCSNGLYMTEPRHAVGDNGTRIQMVVGEADPDCGV